MSLERCTERTEGMSEEEALKTSQAAAANPQTRCVVGCLFLVALNVWANRGRTGFLKGGVLLDTDSRSK